MEDLVNFGPKRIFGIVFRLAAVIGFIFTWICERRLPLEVTGDYKYLGYWRYLTNQNFLICIAATIVLLVGEFTKRARWIGHVMSISLAYPISCILFIYYWGMRAMDPELIHEGLLEVSVPFWHDIVMHVIVLVVALFNILYQPLMDISPWMSYGMSLGYWLFYMVIIYVVYYGSGEWIYGFMKLLKVNGIWLILLPVTTSITCLFQKVGWLLNRWVWRNVFQTPENSKLLSADISDHCGPYSDLGYSSDVKDNEST